MEPRATLGHDIIVVRSYKLWFIVISWVFT